MDRRGIDAEELMEVKRGEWPLARIEREAESVSPSSKPPMRVPRCPRSRIWRLRSHWS